MSREEVLDPSVGQEAVEESIWCSDTQQLSVLIAKLVEAHPGNFQG